MKKYKDLKSDGGSNIIAQVETQIGQIADRLATVKYKLAIMSGKGGVGKSSVTVNLAAALAMKNLKVGILDADINGPSIAKMTGVSDHDVTPGIEAMCPAESSLGIKVMSMDFFLSGDSTPVIWDTPLAQQDAFTYRGVIEVSTLRQLVSETEWGELDFLFIDLPPGTDRLPNIEGAIGSLDGAIVVTIPAIVSQLAVRKSIALAQNYLRTPVIGIIENMSSYLCPDCGKTNQLFLDGNVTDLAKSFDLNLLGSVPFDPRWAECADQGVPYMQKYGGSPTGQTIEKIAEILIERN